MGAFFSNTRCFYCRPVEKQRKMKKALMRAVISIMRCFFYGRVKKLRKIKKDFMVSIVTLIRCFIFEPVAKLRKIKKDLVRVIISAIRWLICTLLEKPRKIKGDESSPGRIYPEVSNVEINSEQHIEKNQEACFLPELHLKEPNEKKQGICLDTFRKSIPTDTSHDRNDKAFEECEDHQSSSSSSRSLQEEVFTSSLSFLSCEAPKAYGSVKPDFEVSGFDTSIGNSEFVEGKKEGPCLPKELHFKEQMQKKKEGSLVNEFEESIENKQDSSLVNELDESAEKKQDTCLLDELPCAEPTENFDEREQRDTRSAMTEYGWISSYSSSQKILLVGERDFSFSASLALAFGSASNMIATSLYSVELLRTNHRGAIPNIKKLASRGCRVLHGVDAKQLANNPQLKGMIFDRIIFNFPFSGFVKTEPHKCQLRGHRRLVSLFLKNAKEMINEMGEIHITQETKALDNDCNIEQLASSHQLRLVEVVDFNCADYPCYSTRHGFGGDDPFVCTPRKTYKFGHKKASPKRKQKRENSEPIGEKQNAHGVEKVHPEECVKNVGAKGYGVVMGVLAEEERGNHRGCNSVMIPQIHLVAKVHSKKCVENIGAKGEEVHMVGAAGEERGSNWVHDQNEIECQDCISNLSTDATGILHDQNDMTSEKCQDYQSNSRTFISPDQNDVKFEEFQEQEVFISAASSPYSEDPNLFGTFQRVFEVSGLCTSDYVEQKKRDAYLLVQQHTDEPNGKKQEGCSLSEKDSEEPSGKKQNVRDLFIEAVKRKKNLRLLEQLHLKESRETQHITCLPEESLAKGPIENFEGEQVDTKGVMAEERWIHHYSSFQKILLVGEGDFSFAASLSKAFGSASHMIATSLDSEEFLWRHYLRANLNIKNLTSRGCRVLHGVDATKMTDNKLLKGMKFDRIIFNFPFAGFFKNELRHLQLWRHQHLVSMFLENAKEMINETGEIHITHKTNGFHSEWNIEELASTHGLGLIEAVDFNCSDYPGYSTKCGFGGDNNFNCNPSKTYKFGLRNVKIASNKKKKNKKQRDFGLQADLRWSFNRTMMEYPHGLPQYLDCSLDDGCDPNCLGCWHCSPDEDGDSYPPGGLDYPDGGWDCSPDDGGECTPPSFCYCYSPCGWDYSPDDGECSPPSGWDCYHPSGRDYSPDGGLDCSPPGGWDYSPDGGWDCSPPGGWDYSPDDGGDYFPPHSWE